MELPDITLQVLGELSDLCGLYSEWLERKNPQIKNCFNMIQKHSMQSHELLWYYWKVWYPNELDIKRQMNTTQEDIESFVKQCTERFMLVVQSGFIFSLSIVEYFLKLIIKQAHEGPFLDWYLEVKRKHEEKERRRKKKGKKKKKLRISLRGIIKKSKELEMFSSASQFNSWLDIIELRNAIMHNNAIADEDTIFKIGSIEIETKSGNIISYPLSDRPRITKVLVELTRNWLGEFFNLH